MQCRFYLLVAARTALGDERGERPGSADLAVAVLPAGGQLVFRGGHRLVGGGAFAGGVRNSAGQLAHRSGDGDAEDTLPALQQVDDLFGRGALIDRGAVGEQRDVGQALLAGMAPMAIVDAYV